MTCTWHLILRLEQACGSCVHPENTLQLAHALQEAGKQFDLMLYPTSRHGIHGDHYTKLLFNFMVEAMGKPEARQP